MCGGDNCGGSSRTTAAGVPRDRPPGLILRPSPVTHRSGDGSRSGGASRPGGPFAHHDEPSGAWRHVGLLVPVQQRRARRQDRQLAGLANQLLIGSLSVFSQGHPRSFSLADVRFPPGRWLCPGFGSSDNSPSSPLQPRSRLEVAGGADKKKTSESPGALACQNESRK